MCADSNQDVASLMRRTDPSIPDWGFGPMKWDLELGNVLAVRADGKDLDVEDVKLMCFLLDGSHSQCLRMH